MNNLYSTQSYNEISARYKELPNEFYIPKKEYIGNQSKDNKQVRDLTANKNNGTLINSPSFNSANGGSIVFDGDIGDGVANAGVVGVTAVGNALSSSITFNSDDYRFDGATTFTAAPSTINLKSDRINYWKGVGAQPTDRVKRLIKAVESNTETADK